jgi:hypothetical protein
VSIRGSPQIREKNDPRASHQSTRTQVKFEFRRILYRMRDICFLCKAADASFLNLRNPCTLWLHVYSRVSHSNARLPALYRSG